MNLYHLKYFLDSVEAGSMSVSAKKNHITHSAISQAIRALENELGVDLLNHNKRKFELTDAGKASLPPLKELLDKMQRVRGQIRDTLDEPSGELIVWAPQSLIVDSLIESFIGYQKKYPKVKLVIHTGAAFLVSQKVLENQCHLGIAINDHKMHHFGTFDISQGEFVLVSPNKKAQIKNESILISSKEKIEVQHLIYENAKLKLPDLKLDTQIMSWGLIKEFSLRGHGIAYVPEYVVKKELKEKRLFKINHPGKSFKYEVVAIWNGKLEIERNARLLIEMIHKK